MANISLGVPQGSILGPLLYIIYTNDIQFSSKFFHFINYADDTTLLNSMAQVHDSAVVNTELKNVCDWLSANRLSLNIKKTKFMVFHNKNKKVDTIAFDIKVENMKIDRISAFNLLGITLDEHLNWNSHINVTSMKIARSVGILHKVKNILPEYILKTLYNSLVLPHLTYGILAWGNNTSVLNKLQKKAIRIISNVGYRDHTEPQFKKLNILKLEDIYKTTLLKFYFNYCHKSLHSYFNCLELTPRFEMHDYNVRSRKKLHITKVRTKMAESSIRYTLPRLINETATLILDKILTHSFQGFTLYMKQFFINKYKAECDITNCFIYNR